MSSEHNGRYHLWAPAGELELVVKANGYPEHRQRVEVRQSGSQHAIQLSRA